MSQLIPTGRFSATLKGTFTPSRSLGATMKLNPWFFSGVPRDNAIAFAFANDIGANVDALCWIAARGFGALYGLDNNLYCPDVMSDTQGCGTKTFTNFDATCGESATPRTCNIPGSPATQNSALRLGQIPGRADVIFRGLFEAAGPSP